MPPRGGRPALPGTHGLLGAITARAVAGEQEGAGWSWAIEDPCTAPARILPAAQGRSSCPQRALEVAVMLLTAASFASAEARLWGHPCVTAHDTQADIH